MSKSKEEIIKNIKSEIPYVDIKPFCHNIISLELRLLAEEYGQEEANKLIRTTKLSKLGWNEEKDEENNKQKELFYDLVDIYKEP